MKRTFWAYFLAVLLLGGICLRAEDWKTIDGKVYPEVKVIKVEADAVTILYRDGGALIPLIMLPDGLQQRFHYNAAVAKAAAEARDMADFENARALREEHLQIVAQRATGPKTQDTSTDLAKSADDPMSPPADSSHHTIADLADSIYSLQNSGGRHYSIGDSVTTSSLSVPAADPNHHSMDSLLGSGDPLSQ
jgi:hypothetical protein